MADEIDAASITKYLESQSDFDLELFVYHALIDHGIQVTHGGTYVDPVTRKYRQYDMRAMRTYESECGISMAIECKRLTREFPLVVLRVPRPTLESFHEVVVAGIDPADNNYYTKRPRREDGRGIYRTNEMVGKKAVQIRWDPKRALFVGDDSDTYDKWSQALSSADALIQESYQTFRRYGGRNLFVTFVMPILVVSDSTLWAADYSDSGERKGEPAPADSATLFVDREYGESLPRGYYIGHLHVFTRTGFTHFVKELSMPDSRFREQVFGFVKRPQPG
jgi:hypothetical protein